MRWRKFRPNILQHEEETVVFELNAEPEEPFNMDERTAQFLSQFHMPVKDRQNTNAPEEKFSGWDRNTLQSLN